MKDHQFDVKNCMVLDSSSLQVSRIRSLSLSERCNHYCTKFNRGRQNGLTKAGKPTVSVERSRFIMALAEMVGQPPQLMQAALQNRLD
jgi:hypothetical protein